MSVWRCINVETNEFDMAAPTAMYSFERITGELPGETTVVAGTAGLFTLGEFYDDDLNHLPNGSIE